MRYCQKLCAKGVLPFINLAAYGKTDRYVQAIEKAVFPRGKDSPSYMILRVAQRANSTKLYVRISQCFVVLRLIPW